MAAAAAADIQCNYTALDPARNKGSVNSESADSVIAAGCSGLRSGTCKV